MHSIFGVLTIPHHNVPIPPGIIQVSPAIDYITSNQANADSRTVGVGIHRVTSIWAKTEYGSICTITKAGHHRLAFPGSREG